MLTSEQHGLYLPVLVYHLFGGSLFTIEAKTFKDRLLSHTDTLSKVLSHSDTIASRNIAQFKNHKDRKLILEASLQVLVLAKNKEMLSSTANEMTLALFHGKDYLSKDDFLQQLQKSQPSTLLTIFPALLRCELLLLEEQQFQQSLGHREDTQQPNFYAHEMNKLLNKCPFNGDERCQCKKCQCVRRNRESAKLNQEKKRNAVEQVDQLKKLVEQLEEQDKLSKRKIDELEEENMMLKELLKEIKLNPTLKSIMRQTI